MNEDRLPGVKANEVRPKFLCSQINDKIRKYFTNCGSQPTIRQ